MPSKHLQTIAHGLILVAIMLGLIAAALWIKGTGLEPQAQARPVLAATKAGIAAGIPDSGRQRQQMIGQLETLNSRLAAIESALRDGSFVIQTVEVKPDDKAADKK